MTLATRIGSIELEDAQTGEARALSDLWEDGPAVVVFIRHFG